MKFIPKSLTAALLISIALGSMPQVARSFDKDSLEKLVKQYTVRIRSGSADPGSGFIVARRGNRYTVISAEHVLRGGNDPKSENPKCTLLKMHDGEVYRVPRESIRLLSRNDLAVFEFESPRDYPVAKLSDYEYPLNSNRDYKTGINSSTAGLETKELISNKQLNRKEFYTFAAGYPNLSQGNDMADNCSDSLTDATIWSGEDKLIFSPGLLADTSGTAIANPESRINNYELLYTNITEVGMSGGPMVDPNGRVIGMHGRSDGKRLGSQGQIIAQYLEEAGESTDSRLTFGMSAGIPTSSILRLSSGLKIDKNTLSITNSPPNTPVVDITAWDKRNPYKSDGQTDVLYWFQRGNQEWRLNQFDEAQRSFDRALEADRKRKNIFQHFGYFLKGFVYTRSQQYTQALENCGKATEVPEGREFYDAWRCKAASLAYLGQFPSATSAMNKAIQIQETKSSQGSKQNPSDYAVLAELLWQQGQHNGALIQVSNAISLRQDQDLGESASLYNLQATILTSLNQYDAAIEKCDRALAINPNYSTALTTKGLVFQKQGKKEPAEALFRQATQLNSQDSNAWNNLGFALYELDRSQEALTAFDRAVQLNPDDVAARQNRDDLRKALKP